MIARHWTGLVKTSHANRYLVHLHHETIPALRAISGFVDVSILRRDVELGVEFLVITRWQSMGAIAKFAGRDLERAVVPTPVQDMMVAYDKTVRHYEVLPTPA